MSIFVKPIMLVELVPNVGIPAKYAKPSPLSVEIINLDFLIKAHSINWLFSSSFLLNYQIRNIKI